MVHAGCPSYQWSTTNGRSRSQGTWIDYGRDRSAEARRRNLRFLADNTRFLILPWVTVPHLASHLLGRMAALVPADWQRLYGHAALLPRDLRRSRALPRHLLSRGELARARPHHRAGPQRPDQPADAAGQRGPRLSPRPGLSRAPDEDAALSRPRRKKTGPRAAPPTIELRFDELGAIVERTKAALSADDHAKLKAAMDTLAFVTAELATKQTSLDRLRRLLFGTKTEKTRTIVGPRPGAPDPGAPAGAAAAPPAPAPPPPGHGRLGAAAYTGAGPVTIPHPALHRGDGCPGCTTGKIYPLAEPATLVRITGMAPLGATVYACERWRCNLCGEVFTAPAPAGVGDAKYDATATSMVGLLKYGCGLPFHRIETLAARRWAFRCRPRRSGSSCAMPCRSSCPPGTSCSGTRRRARSSTTTTPR